MPEPALPIVPLYVNVYLPPQPTPRRCYAWGRTLRTILDARPERVALMVSGGLSHFPGTDRYSSPDFEFDRALLAVAVRGSRGGDRAPDRRRARQGRQRRAAHVDHAAGRGRQCARRGDLLRAVLAPRQRRGGLAGLGRVMDTHYVFPPAAAYPLNRLLFSLKSDPAFRERYVGDADRMMVEAGLDAPTRAALVGVRSRPAGGARRASVPRVHGPAAAGHGARAGDLRRVLNPRHNARPGGARHAGPGGGGRHDPA